SAASLIACWTLLIVRNVKIFGAVGRSGRVRPAATERLAKPTRIPTPTATATVTSGRCSTSLDGRRSASFARRDSTCCFQRRGRVPQKSGLAEHDPAFYRGRWGEAEPDP